MSSWYEKNKEKHKANRRLYYQKNKEKELASVKAWKEANPEAQCVYSKTFREKHPEKVNKIQLKHGRKYREENREKERLRIREYRAKNKHVARAQSAKRKAIKLKQTPKWVDLKAIREFYKNCPEGYHVDHIIPLNGKNVRGLHVLENLQYLPAVENLRKGNKFIL